MAYNAGVTRYQKKKWMDELVTKIGAGSLKMSIHSTTTTWDATTDPTTPQVYGTTGELTYQLDFADVATAAGTIDLGTYCGCIYDTTDTSRVLAICTLTVTQASAGGAMTFTIPADAIALT